MTSKELYKNETGKDAFTFQFNENMAVSSDYLIWLENQVEKTYEPSILTWIKTMFQHAEKKKWNKVYFMIDIHGTISKPDYRKDTKEIIYYTYAMETLKILSDRKDIIMILWTSSYPEELKIYQEHFINDGIIFDYIGKNPEVSEENGSFGYYKDKPYFNLLLDDKASFKPSDWEHLYNFFLNQKPLDINLETKYKEDYHK